MPKALRVVLLVAAVALVSGWLIWTWRVPRIPAQYVRLLADAATRPDAAPIQFLYPLDQTVFPPEIPPPVFRWADGSAADHWLVQLARPGARTGRTDAAAQREWSPPADLWSKLKRQSVERDLQVTVIGWRQANPGQAVSRGQISIRTSRDAVDAPLFYREVNLPFLEAVQDPTRIRWRFGPISSPQPPPAVLHGVPVCGNCHSFARDGQWLGMDVDYANSKGSYVIAPVAKEMALRPQEVITWDDFRREDGQQTFGLLSQISPDGQVVVSTVKDRSVFVARPDLAFSQLFFPIKGILATYDRRTRKFAALPGADDPAYVQSNPVWSPDGQYIVFARARAYQLRKALAPGQVLLSPEECEEFLKEGKPFQFELCRLPYNQGKGGRPEPLEGASRNGFSNYFPKYSPDGKWIVFCQARNYMLLQPDSALYIIPAHGGPARRLRANLARMNSWHSWSPNSRWLVFASKANSPYTQLFLTHIDEAGNSTPAVSLAHLTAPDRAANIPEFVNALPTAIERIQAQFLNDYSHARAGYTSERTGHYDNALAEYQRALALNPANVNAHERLGYLLYFVKHDYPRGLSHAQEAVRLAPTYGQGHYVLGVMLLDQGRLEAAIQHLTAAGPGIAQSTDPGYNAASVHGQLGLALLRQKQYAASTKELAEAVRGSPEDAEVRFSLAAALVHQGQIEAALEHYRLVIARKPELDNVPEWHAVLSLSYAKAGRFDEAVPAAQKALTLAQAARQEELAREIQARLVAYQQHTVPADGP